MTPRHDAPERVVVRPIQPSDAAQLRDAFVRLSDRSRQRRFLFTKKDLSNAEVRYFTDVDHHDHEALVALSRSDGRVVGVARYVRLRHDATAADVAVTVADDWQRRGLGWFLITKLIERAGHEGVDRFIALVADDNAVVAAMLAKNGRARTVSGSDGSVEYEIALSRAPAAGSAGTVDRQSTNPGETDEHAAA